LGALGALAVFFLQHPAKTEFLTMKLQPAPTLRMSANSILLSLAALSLLVHLFANAFTAYGYFRDELYYIACSEHLDIGYVDQPPFSIYVLGVNRLLFGDSLFALRLVPAFLHALTVFLTGLMARELGGGRFAQTLAAVAALFSPIYLAMHTVFNMNCFDILVWTAASYTLIKILREPDDHHAEQPTKRWITLGIILGLGLLNKISVLWLGAGITVGLLLTPRRRWFRTRWPWIAGGIAFLLFLPYIIWNLQHDLAHLEFIRNASGDKYASATRLAFIAGQVLLQNPLALPLWIAGLFFLLFDKNGSQFRLLGIVYAVAFLILLTNGHSKPEYLSPAYTMLFAAGGIISERLTAPLTWRWVRPGYLVLLLVGGCALAPLAMPTLPVEAYIKYQDALGVSPATAEAKQLEKLPQFYADMFGWEEKAAAVARVFNTLTPEEKARCAIFADNYGRCAAIDFFGARYGLPKSIGKHNNYWIWGPRQYTGEIVIILGGNPDEHTKWFEEVTVADTTSCTYCMPYENHLTISLCRKLKMPLQEVWAPDKHYE
jgi:4-amino-4-deoxy-L-arabinose transferase-like glycosyltransferase